ncbi:nitronate monooxygenase [Nocardioides bigeumensis]|uniref:Nitronate monooxygenase n=1 Tax=Nocardioides bigeumensis TaxID=433657 RepID=A0ABN2YM11_9ACTN
MTNWLAEALGCSVPLVLAPMAGPGRGRLANAVSKAGGFGMFGVGNDMSGEAVRAEAATAGTDGGRYGVGLLAWAQSGNPDQLDAVLDLRPDLVSVSFGDVSVPVRRLRDAGIRTATQVGALSDLDLAHDAGVDLIVARGAEGGGHGRNAMGTLPLLQMILDRTDRPVLAAGGILNHRGLAAVLAAGAQGAWVGTAFLGCAEAEMSSSARARLIEQDETGYGRVFDVAQGLAWPPEFGGRALVNDFYDEWVGREDDMDDAARLRHQEARKTTDFAVAHLYAGEGVAALVREQTAEQVVREFARALDQ